MKEDGVIRFQATVAQVKTMADGGLRLALNLSEHEIDAAAKMMQAKQAGAILEIALLVVDPQKINESGSALDFNFKMQDAFPGIDIKRIE